MNELIQAALEVRQRAYAPYSNFLVGAAVLTGDGQVFVGCNVENASYGLAICAERMAIGAAVAAGKKPNDTDSINIKTIVVAATPLASPCGACRQFIAEFGDQIEIVSVDADAPGQKKTWLISDLLPNSFKL
jgi:cytidine deaminase